MFDVNFEHYLTYGATDQQTVRRLVGQFSGLMIPGTVAAFQREGTGGFALTLSATEAQTPYAIDPRFPLFQQPLYSPKKSHHALAVILGRPELVSQQEPAVARFNNKVIDDIAKHWVDFNTKYLGSANAKFDKYAKRLNEPVAPENAKDPKYVIPPYMMCEGREDPWWAVSCKFFDRTRDHLGEDRCVQIIAAKEARYLSDLLAEARRDRVGVWVSSLDELQTEGMVLAEYAIAIARSSQKIFAMYGGFFSVLLSSVGLGGSCHGIGYGEYRDYLELPQSGPPPARYYLPILHRYVSQELAYQLRQSDPFLAECSCAACKDNSPLDLDYHSLMQHSVLCRSQEIQAWVGLSLEDTIRRLRQEREEFLRRVAVAKLPRLIADNALRSASHLLNWINALSLTRRVIRVTRRSVSETLR